MIATDEQLLAINAVKEGHNVFLFGAGGVGKSYCISQIMKWGLETQVKVAITATTGSSAFLINGTTIHSYLGIGVPSKSATPRSVADYVLRMRKDVVKKLKVLNVLVIDEVSMMDDELFDFTSDYLKIIRNTDEAFGGVRVVLSGDLYQLPPCSGKFVFKADVWKSMNIRIYELLKSHRHQGDVVFSKILQDLRIGKCDNEMIELLKATSTRRLKGATYMFSRNVDVDTINEQKLASIIEKKGVRRVTYTNKNTGNTFAKNGSVPEKVSICVGAHVMLTYNVSMDSGLCNGAQGLVKDVGGDKVLVEFFNGQETWITFIKVTNPEDRAKWVEFMPIRLAYAITIHKSQGMTIDRAVVVLDDMHMKSYGKVYTALSRVRTIDNLSIRGEIKKSMFVPHPDVVEFLKARSTQT